MRIMYNGPYLRGRWHLGHKTIEADRGDTIEVTIEEFNKMPQTEFIILDDGGFIEADKKTDREKLIEMRNIEDELADALLARFGSFDAVRMATEKELEAIPGIGKKIAKKIKNQMEEGI